jgi:hypothetical protein
MFAVVKTLNPSELLFTSSVFKDETQEPLGEFSITEFDSASNGTEYQEPSWGYRRAGRMKHRADNLTAICQPIVGSSTSHNPMGDNDVLQG